MDYENWEPNYRQILADFDFDPADDESSAGFLARRLEELEKNLEPVSEIDLQDLIMDKKVFVFGEGPTLEEDLKNFSDDGTVIAADGATSALLEHDIIPDIIVSDLDGAVEDQVEAVSRGAIILIHAHGDNRDKLEKWLPGFRGRVMGTSQSRPPKGLYNFGGFTDGDRSVYLADHFKADSIDLIAFDFLEVGDSAKKSGEEVKLKLRKLTWANLLIGLLANPRVNFVPPPGKNREFLF